MFSRVVNNNDTPYLDLKGHSIFIDAEHIFVLNSNSTTAKDSNGKLMFFSGIQLGTILGPLDFVPEVAVRVWRV